MLDSVSKIERTEKGRSIKQSFRSTSSRQCLCFLSRRIKLPFFIYFFLTEKITTRDSRGALNLKNELHRLSSGPPACRESQETLFGDSDSKASHSIVHRAVRPSADSNQRSPMGARRMAALIFRWNSCGYSQILRESSGDFRRHCEFQGKSVYKIDCTRISFLTKRSKSQMYWNNSSNDKAAARWARTRVPLPTMLSAMASHKFYDAALEKQFSSERFSI